MKSKLRSLIAGTLLITAVNASGAVRYVDVNSILPAPPYGTWATAAFSIQDAVDAASAGDEIVVTNGIYATGGRVRDEDGTIQNRLTVDKPLAIRSVNGPLFTVIHGGRLTGENIRCVSLVSNTGLSGFTLTNGMASQAGGVWCESTTAVLSNCVVAGNLAISFGYEGGGGGVVGGTLNRCALTSNSAIQHDPDLGNQGSGGAASNCMLNDCMLTGNSANSAGGAVFRCTLNNCTVTGNSATNGGGGASGSTLNNCLVSGNWVNGGGGGGGAINCTLNNCTVTGNSANWAGGARSSTLNNCIVYFNTSAVDEMNWAANYEEGTNDHDSSLNYCCTMPLPSTGVGNLTNAPFFFDQSGGNLRLQSNSLCINAGNNLYAVGSTDLDGRPRIVGGTVDIGAYEFQPSAQPIITKQPTNQTASLFADTTFRVTVQGDTPLSYQWRFNGLDLIGRTNASLTVANVQRSNAGDYDVVVNNLSGSLISQVATLTITPFNSLYAFGHSWVYAPGIVPEPTQCFTWSDPQKYYQGHACNGPMWPEILSTNLGLAYLRANNYAVCGATSSDVLDQVSISLVRPGKPQLSLYLLWAGDAEFLQGIPPDGLRYGYLNVTNEVGWNQLIHAAVLNNLSAIESLYAKGARTVMIQSQFDFSKFPVSLQRFGTNSAGLSKLSEYCGRFNAGFRDALMSFSHARSDLRIIWIDMFSNLNEVLENPAQYGFTKTTIDTLSDPALADKSFAGPGAQYVWWDINHPTSKFHDLIAEWHLDALSDSILEKLDLTISSGLPNIRMAHLQIGRDYTLQKSVGLTNWQEATTFTASAGTNLWQPPIENESAVYYRLKWQR